MYHKTIKTIYKNNYQHIIFNFKTKNQKTLNTIHKNFNLQQTYKTIQLYKKTNIKIINFFIINSPKKTKQSINITIDFSYNLNIKFTKYTYYIPYPNTKIYYNFLKNKTLKKPKLYNFKQYTSYPTPNNPTIYITPTLTQSQLQTLQKKTFHKFYLQPHIIYKHLFKIQTLNTNNIINNLQLIFTPTTN